MEAVNLYPKILNIPSVKSGNYTLVDADDFVIFNCTAARTASLPTAVGRSGKVFRFKKIGSDFHEALPLTIDPAGTETVDGFSTIKLHSLNETMGIVSDGSNWKVIENSWPGSPVSVTNGFKDVTHDSISANVVALTRISSTRVQLEGRIRYSGTPSGGAGLQVTLPDNCTMSTTYTLPLASFQSSNVVAAFARSDTNYYPVVITMINYAAMSVRVVTASGTYDTVAQEITPSTPLSIATGDTVYISMSYNMAGLER